MLAFSNAGKRFNARSHPIHKPFFNKPKVALITAHRPDDRALNRSHLQHPPLVQRVECVIAAPSRSESFILAPQQLLRRLHRHYCCRDRRSSLRYDSRCALHSGAVSVSRSSSICNSNPKLSKAVILSRPMLPCSPRRVEQHLASRESDRLILAVAAS